MPEPSADTLQVAKPVISAQSATLSPEVGRNPNLLRRQAAWDAKRQEIEHWGDGLGHEIDEGIKDTVVAFLVNGINTTASCEGHTDHGLASPWIDFAAPDQPERFVGEETIYQRVAQEQGISVEDIKRWKGEKAKDAWWAVIEEGEKAGETPEYKRWRTQTEQLEHQTESLLDEFYSKRQVAPEARLYATQITDEGGWRVMAGTVEKHWSDKPVHPPEETETLLLARRAEMAAFTDFLKRRYFSQTELSESQRAFEDAVSHLGARLQSEVFTSESPLARPVSKDVLTLEEVRRMFFVDDLKALGNSTLWQTDNHIATTAQDVEQQRARGEVSVNASVDRGVVDVIADAPESQSDIPFNHAWLVGRESLLFPGRQVYELTLKGGYRDGTLIPAYMTGRYTQGQFVDRVSLTYPDGSRIRKIFWHNPLKETYIDAVSPPQGSSK